MIDVENFDQSLPLVEDTEELEVELPKVIGHEQLFVYLPIASNLTPGLVVVPTGKHLRLVNGRLVFDPTGLSVEVDDFLSLTSSKPVKNSVLTEAINTLKKRLDEVNTQTSSANISVEKVASGHKVTINNPNGNKETFIIPDGKNGEGFSISKVYSSVAAMNAGFATDGVLLYGFVLIDTGDVNDEDNAKLFVKRESGYTYLTDLSGAQGIQGPPGEDYSLTTADKNDIAEIVLSLLPRYNGEVEYL